MACLKPARCPIGEAWAENFTVVEIGWLPAPTFLRFPLILSTICNRFIPGVCTHDLIQEVH